MTNNRLNSKRVFCCRMSLRSHILWSQNGVPRICGVSRQARVVDPSRRANRRFANRLALSGGGSSAFSVQPTVASFLRKLAPLRSSTASPIRVKRSGIGVPCSNRTLQKGGTLFPEYKGKEGQPMKIASRSSWADETDVSWKEMLP
jgi:hypothetical protein